MKCLICKKANNRKIKKINDVNIFECKDCELGFVDQNKKQKIAAKNLYSFNEYKKEVPRLRKRFEKLVKTINEFKSTGKVLDIGGGYGLLSETLSNLGNYEITLLEPSQIPYFAKEKNIKILKKNLNSFAKTSQEKFDIVFMCDVIEHFSNSLAPLKLAKNMLTRNGILIVQTPNYKSLMARLVKNWSWWFVEEHKFFFSPKSIKLLIKKQGFEIKSFYTYEDFIDFKRNLDGNFTFIKNSFMRKLLKAVLLEFFVAFYFLARRFIWSIHKGGLMFLICSKNDRL